MARIPRGLIKEENRCYHVISRTVGQAFVLGDLEKEYLLRRIRKLSAVYFVNVFTFSVLSNHFHLLVQMRSGSEFSDVEIERRFRLYYGEKRPFPKERLEDYRKKWGDLSEYVKEIKQGFSVWYNRRHNRHGYFWSERFKSVVVENGDALLSCMAYIDLNAVRAGLVDRPEEYRFCGLGYHLQSGNQGRFLTLELPVGFSQIESLITSYRKYVYEVGGVERSEGDRGISEAVLAQEAHSGYRLRRTAIFRYRTRYFTESVALGSRIFVEDVYRKLRPHGALARGSLPIKIEGAEALYVAGGLRTVSV